MIHIDYHVRRNLTVAYSALQLRYMIPGGNVATYRAHLMRANVKQQSGNSNGQGKKSHHREAFAEDTTPVRSVPSAPNLRLPCNDVAHAIHPGQYLPVTQRPILLLFLGHSRQAPQLLQESLYDVILYLG
mmetsp:Transcript_44275/g.110072  ORF Transcript_44275/g.110072 Transcript_44275/m.110072 type:complete len:130 (-) Transcript_44275:680-1069(-)